MNDDLEQRLRDARPARPSAELDCRMDALFAAAGPAGRSRVRWWRLIVLPAAGLAAAWAVFWLLPRPVLAPAVPAPVVYVVEPTGLMKELLAPHAASAPPSREATVHRGEISP